jgi:hypothetical protein
LTFGNVVFKTIIKEFVDRWEEVIQVAKEGRDAAYAAKLDLSVL